MPAGSPQFHVDRNRSASVAQTPPDLLTYCPALRIGERHVGLATRAAALLEWFEIGLEGWENEAVSLRRRLHVPEPRLLEERAQSGLVTERERAGRCFHERRRAAGNDNVDPTVVRALGRSEHRNCNAPARAQHAIELRQAARRVLEEHEAKAAQHRVKAAVVEPERLAVLDHD